MPIFSDKTLSQKIERTEALSNVAFVESHAKLFPESKAEWVEIGGVYAMFDGAAYPTTQTFGLGMFDEVTDNKLNKLENFYKEKNVPVNHVVSPLAGLGVFKKLGERGYQPVELSNVTYLELKPENITNSFQNSEISTRKINKDEIELFAKTSTKGWLHEIPDYAEVMFELSKIGASSKGAIPFFAELNEEPIATGTLFIYDDTAILAGASTIPEARRQGAQNALLNARLNYALESGCKIAIMDAMPGSQSQRNAEKNGFRIAYTRTKLQLK